jgi:hypothetical protein
MVTALSHGSGMGPGEGWFHAGQSRYSWDWLAKHHGIPSDGTISRKDFRGPAEWFDRLDRNRDGVLSAADFNPATMVLFHEMVSGHWFRMIDTNSNGRISEEEWKAVFQRASKGKGYLTAEDLRDAFPVSPPPRPPGPPPKDDDGPSPLVLLAGLLSGELGSICEGPNIGQRAPDFTLPTQDGDRRIRLSQFRGKKPVVLIFGSFT